MKKLLILPTLLLLTCCYVSPDEAIANDHATATRADSTVTPPQTVITIKCDTVWRDTVSLPIDPVGDVNGSKK